MVAVHQKERRPHQAQAGSLAQVDGLHRIGINVAQGIDAEVVADGQVEVRVIGSGSEKRLRIQRGVVLLRTLGVGIPLEAEGERAAGESLGVKPGLIATATTTLVDGYNPLNAIGLV